MITRRFTILFLAGILLTSMVAFPFVTFSSELNDDAEESEIMQDSTRNGFEPAADLHDYFMMPMEDGYWLDAKTNGYNLSLTGFNVYAAVDLGFDFLFYDTNFSTVYVSNYGYMSFVDSTPTRNGIPYVPYPDSDYTYCLAPFWEHMPATDNIYVWNTTEYVVIEYNGMYEYMGSEMGTFQVVLYNDGTIDFNYLEILLIDSPVVCLNNGDGVHGSSYPVEELLGVTNFTIRFEYYIAGPEFNIKLDGPAYTEIGSTYLFNTTTKNLGNTAETYIQVVYFLDEVFINATSILSLAPGENFTHTYKFSPVEEGLVILRATVEQIPGEYTYNNNEASMKIIVSTERSYAIFQDEWPWTYSDVPDATAVALDDHGISYDIYDRTFIGNLDLTNYTKVIISSSQPTLFYEWVYGNLTWFEDYAASGGILEVHAADQSSEQWVNGTLPGDIEYVRDAEDFVDIVAPWHQILNTPYSISDDDLDDWNSAIHGHIVNLSIPAQVILGTLVGEPVLIEFPLGDGHIIITTQTVEWSYGTFNSRFLDNLLLYTPQEPEHEVVVSLYTPRVSIPSEEISLNIYVSNWGSVPETDVVVTVYANEELLYSETLPALANGTTFNEEIYWTPIFPGTYELSLYAEPVAGEEIVDNNMATKVLTVRSEVGSILWDSGHGCHDPTEYYSAYLEQLEVIGYRVDVTSDPINETILADYSVYVCAEPEVNYWANETAALQAYVMDGGGFFVIGDSFQPPLNNLTNFAGIEWLSAGEWGGTTENITEHVITEGVSEVYFSSPVSYFNLSSPATGVVFLDNLPALVVSEVGAGRIVAIADDNCFDTGEGDNLYESDNNILALNIIDWLAEGRTYNEIFDVQQDPEEVTHEDTVDISCMVTDLVGVDSVTLHYRVDGGSWMTLGMSPTLEDTYEATIPAQTAGALVEYYISTTNVLNITTINNNDGELYRYTVAIPTPTTTTTSVSTTTTATTSTTVTTSTTTTAPTTPNGTLPDNTMVIVIIIVGAGGAILVIVIVIVMKKRAG